MPSISTLVCALAARDSNAAKRISKCFFINYSCLVLVFSVISNIVRNLAMSHTRFISFCVRSLSATRKIDSSHSFNSFRELKLMG